MPHAPLQQAEREQPDEPSAQHDEERQPTSLAQAWQEVMKVAQRQIRRRAVAIAGNRQQQRHQHGQHRRRQPGHSPWMRTGTRCALERCAQQGQQAVQRRRKAAAKVQPLAALQLGGQEHAAVPAEQHDAPAPCQGTLPFGTHVGRGQRPARPPARTRRSRRWPRTANAPSPRRVAVRARPSRPARSAAPIAGSATQRSSSRAASS